MRQAAATTASLEPVAGLAAHAPELRLVRGGRTRALPAHAALGLDLAMLALAAGAAQMGAQAAGVAPLSLAWTLAFPLLVLAGLLGRGLYRPVVRLKTLDDLRTVLTATTLALLVLEAVVAVADSGAGIADELVRSWAFASVYLAAGRVALYRSVRAGRRDGEGLRPTLIVGAGRIGRLTAKRLLASPDLGLRPIGFLDKDPLDGSAEGVTLPVLGASWDLERVVAAHRVEQVIISFSTAPNDVLLRLVRRCEELGVEVAVVPRFYEKVTTRLEVEHVGGIPLLYARSSDPDGWQFAIKYTLDRVVAALGLLVALPVLLAAALAVRVSLGSPVLFRQPRVGLDGRQFEILKFRTMRDEQSQEPFALADDLAPGGVEGADRRTRVGTFLRRTSIDELPQLLNVLKGEMSLVGPRPERPEYVDEFVDRVYRYGDRHRVKSGITGWAQINGLRGKTSISDRAEWDNHYIENFSLWLDLKIVLLTGITILRLYRTVE
jgi:exopolysaccharide biosynthesis polyprenyl glycosylphosphotransferase